MGIFLLVVGQQSFFFFETENVLTKQFLLENRYFTVFMYFMEYVSPDHGKSEVITQIGSLRNRQRCKYTS